MKIIVKKSINFILNSIFYFSVFYILGSTIKLIYMYLVNIINISRITIGSFYIDELIIAILVCIFMFRHIRVKNALCNYLK